MDGSMEVVTQQVFLSLWLEAIPVTWDTTVQAYEALSATQHVVHATDKNNPNVLTGKSQSSSHTKTTI